MLQQQQLQRAFQDQLLRVQTQLQDQLAAQHQRHLNDVEVIRSAQSTSTPAPLDDARDRDFF